MTTALHRSPRPQPTRSVLSAYRDNLRWQLDQSASRYAAGDTVQAALVVIGDWLYADTDRTLAEYLSARIPPARLEAVPPDRHRAVVEAIVLLTQAAHDEQQRETARG